MENLFNNLIEEPHTIKNNYPLFCNHITKSIESLITDLINVKNDENYMQNLQSCVDLLIKAYSEGNKLLIIGNGSNASDAQSLASKLNNINANYPAIALTTNTSLLTSACTDEYDEVFAKQVKGLGMYNDVLFVISNSGDSISAIKAIQVAKSRKMKVIGLLGNRGGKIKKDCDVSIDINLNDFSRIQEMNKITSNLICQLIAVSLH